MFIKLKLYQTFLVVSTKFPTFALGISKNNQNKVGSPRVKTKRSILETVAKLVIIVVTTNF